MKKEIGIALLLTVILPLTVGCGKNESVSTSNESNEQFESNIMTETIETTQMETTKTQHSMTTQSINTESTECTTSEIPTQESSEYIERQIVEAICIELYGQMVEPYPVLGKNSEIIEYENDADYLIQTAKTLPERCLGTIANEEMLIEKAREVWIERLGAEYIERVESEYVDVDGVKMKFERQYPTYHIEYYEAYDVWYIVPNPPCGIREDGVSFAVIWDFPPYLLIRGEDGIILGAFI